MPTTQAKSTDGIMLSAAVDEVERLMLICQNVHDRLLRGDDDATLAAMLVKSWRGEKKGEAK